MDVGVAACHQMALQASGVRICINDVTVDASSDWADGDEGVGPAGAGPAGAGPAGPCGGWRPQLRRCSWCPEDAGGERDERVTLGVAGRRSVSKRGETNCFICRFLVVIVLI